MLAILSINILRNLLCLLVISANKLVSDLEQFKAALEKCGIKNTPDDDVIKLIEKQEKLAAIIFAMWLEHINGGR